MICGQETKGWNKFSTSIIEGMNKYKDFITIKQPYKGYKKSAFWKGYNFFRKELIKKYPEKKLYFIWNNISKIGKSHGRVGVSKDIQKLERHFFPVFREEILILKPDIVIFFTGNRDGDIKYHFPNIDFEDLNMQNSKTAKRKYKAASKIICKSNVLPKKSIRLYHPSYFGGFNYVKKDALDFILEI